MTKLPPAVVIVSMLFGSSYLPGQNASKWQLIWSDEFNGAAHAAPDPTKWNFDLGGSGWGNGEQQTYTDSPSNIFQDGQGHLVIRAVRDGAGNYSSARIRSGAPSTTSGANGSWKYGKVEARIKLPYGAGIWPAFWMLGDDIASVQWPACGEIDILETFGTKIDDPATIHATIHGPGYQGKGVGAPYHLPAPQRFTDDFHVFTVEWSENHLEFFVDGVSYQKLDAAALPKGGVWSFNHPFFVLLNLAIGGPKTFLGGPAPDTPFPQEMLVDYVRVYRATP